MVINRLLSGTSWISRWQADTKPTSSRNNQPQREAIMVETLSSAAKVPPSLPSWAVLCNEPSPLSKDFPPLGAQSRPWYNPRNFPEKESTEMAYQHVKVPEGGKISVQNSKLNVPDHPIVPFIEGDGTGRDIWRASVRVLDAAVEKAYKGKRKISWMEVYAGEKSFTQFNTWLPDETVAAFREFLVGIKGPLTTPIGGGIRSLNVALRQLLDLYVCSRPVRWFKDVPSPVKRPDRVDMVIFRENTEDIYTGIDLENGSEDNLRFKQLLKEHF